MTAAAFVAPLVAPDSLRAVLREVFRAAEYRWRAPAPRGTGWLADLVGQMVVWLDRLREAHPERYYALLAVLTLVLLVIAAHLAWVVWRSLRAPVAAAPESGGPGPRPGRDAAWHLAEARRGSAAGRYAEALGHRFAALVLELDRRRALGFHPAKTPAEYAAEARLDAAGRAALAQLVQALYRHLFGGLPCGPAEWEAFDRRAAALTGSGGAAR